MTTAKSSNTNQVESQDGQFIASMALYQFPKEVRALVRIADEAEEWIDVPPHMAAQLPMAISMMRNAGG